MIFFRHWRLNFMVVFVRIEGKNALKLVFYSCSWSRFLKQVRGAIRFRKNYNSLRPKEPDSCTSDKSETARTKGGERESRLQSTCPLRLNRWSLLLFFFSEQLGPSTILSHIGALGELFSGYVTIAARDSRVCIGTARFCSGSDERTALASLDTRGGQIFQLCLVSGRTVFFSHDCATRVHNI